MDPFGEHIGIVEQSLITVIGDCKVPESFVDKFEKYTVSKIEAIDWVSDAALDKITLGDSPYRCRDTDGEFRVIGIQIQGNPFYERHKLGLSLSSKLVHCLLTKKLFVTDTFVATEELEDFFEYLQSFDSYSIRNFGKIWVCDGNSVNGVTVHPTAQGKLLIAFDGIIAAGKTTVIGKTLELMKGAERNVHYIPEPLKEIYATIDKYKDDVKKLRQEKVEEVVLKYELAELAKLEDGMTVFIERNWLYAEWVFGVKDVPYPVFCPELEKAISKIGNVKLITVFLDTHVDLAMDRIKIRAEKEDRNDMVDPKALESDRRRLQILFNSWYDWPYADSMTLEDLNAIVVGDS